MPTHMPIDRQQRPRYTAAQLHDYFTRISLPTYYQSSPVVQDPTLAVTKEHGLPLLRALQLYHLANIPFENLELHYSAKKTITLNMNDLYENFVVRGSEYGRGGRCMENNGLFSTVLRSLGYEVRNCAGRVSRSWSPNAETREKLGQTYDPWNHMLNLVRIEQQWYVVDVGMGAMGPNIIYPLEDGYETVAIPPRKIRIQRRAIPESSASTEASASMLWCYDVNLKPSLGGFEDTWIPTYCFTETEYLPADYEMMSFYTSHNSMSFFTYSILCTRLLFDPQEEQIIGDITLFNDAVRKTEGGRRELLAELKTEQDRVKALNEILGVRLTEEEKQGISLNRRLG